MAFSAYIEKATDKISSVTEELKFKAECGMTSVRDSVIDGVDTSVAAAKKTYSVVTETYSFVVNTGIIVAGIVAPIPVFIGAALLWLMKMSIESSVSAIDDELKNSKQKREFDRLITLLKKYGRIPAVSLVETDFIKMEINSQEGLADGEILQGKFKSRKLSELDDESIQLLITFAPDSDTADLISAYYAFKKRRDI